MDERSTQAVFEDHLRCRKDHDLVGDLRNYAEDVVILSNYGTFYGHDGVRESGDVLKKQLPDSTYSFQTTETSGEVAFLVWTAESGSKRVEDGVDSFHIRDGLIRVQTIHYRVIDAG